MTPRKLESCPPLARAPLNTGRLSSGAVNSSWTWNRLSFVFIPPLLSARSPTVPSACARPGPPPEVPHVLHLGAVFLTYRTRYTGSKTQQTQIARYVRLFSPILGHWSAKFRAFTAATVRNQPRT